MLLIDIFVTKWQDFFWGVVVVYACLYLWVKSINQSVIINSIIIRESNGIMIFKIWWWCSNIEWYFWTMITHWWSLIFTVALHFCLQISIFFLNKKKLYLDNLVCVFSKTKPKIFYWMISIHLLLIYQCVIMKTSYFCFSFRLVFPKEKKLTNKIIIIIMNKECFL